MALFGKNAARDNTAPKPKDDKLERISEALTGVGLRHEMGQAKDLRLIEIHFQGENARVILRVISDGGDIKILTEGFAKIPAEKMAAGCAAVNSLNQRYRYIKFLLDDEGHIFADWDLPESVSNEAAAQIVIEMVVRMMQIVDEAYSEIMDIIWL